MRPLLPQSKFNFPVLIKLVVIYGVVALVILLCVVVLEFAVSGFGTYRFVFQLDGVRGVIGVLKEDFVGMDSSFMGAIRQADLLTISMPISAGGIFGVFHYIFVRRRKTVFNIQESSKSDA
jgi:hypothetical protein